MGEMKSRIEESPVSVLEWFSLSSRIISSLEKVGYLTIGQVLAEGPVELRKKTMNLGHHGVEEVKVSIRLFLDAVQKPPLVMSSNVYHDVGLKIAGVRGKCQEMQSHAYISKEQVSAYVIAQMEYIEEYLVQHEHVDSSPTIRRSS